MARAIADSNAPNADDKKGGNTKNQV